MWKKVTVGIKGELLCLTKCLALPGQRINNSSGDMDSYNVNTVLCLHFLLGSVHLTICLLSFWAELAEEEIALTIGVIYLCFNMPYKATLFQN